MNGLGKYLSLCLVVILAVSSLLIINPIHAQAISTPSVPEFTITVVDNSYDVPATTPVYRTDPYTGERTLTEEGHDGYHVQNGTVDLSIHTQKFTSYYDNENHLLRSYIRVAYKGHFETSWNYYLPNYGYYGNESQYLEASADGISKVQFGFGHFSFIAGEDRSIAIPPSLGEISNGGRIDFKVESFIGYSNASQYVTLWGLQTFYSYIGESSGWSDIQTVKITDGSTMGSTSPNSTSSPSPTVPEIPAMILLPLFAVIPLIIAMITRKKNHLTV